MSKFIKGLLQKQFEKKFDGVAEFVVISTDGVSGNQNNEMRGALKDKGIDVRVVKNTLVRHAFKNVGHDGAAELFQSGPCTVVYGGDSAVDVAKEVVSWKKKIKAIELKGAYVDGEIIIGDAVVDLSKMPTRVELQGQIVQIAKTPASNLAGAIMGPAGAIAGCLKSIIEKAENEAA